MYTPATILLFFINQMTKKNIITISIIVLALAGLLWFVFGTVVPAVQKYNAGQKIIGQISLLDEQKKTIYLENSKIQTEYDRCSAYNEQAVVLLSGNKAEIEDIENKQQQLRLQYNRIMDFK